MAKRIDARPIHGEIRGTPKGRFFVFQPRPSDKPIGLPFRYYSYVKGRADVVVDDREELASLGVTGRAWLIRCGFPLALPAGLPLLGRAPADVLARVAEAVRCEIQASAPGESLYEASLIVTDAPGHPATRG